MNKMNKNLSFIIVIVFLFIIFYFGFKSKSETKINKENTDIVNNIVDYKNTTYTIEGKNVVLKNGISEVPILPNSASMITTKYFGNDVKYDWNNDGHEDVAFILTQNDGGSGTFYYVVVAIQSPLGYYTGSNAFFLGDRITPQTLEVQDAGMIVFNYLDRNEGESFATVPTFAKSTWLVFDSEVMDFNEYSPDFY
jgi:hypothetical protein